MATAKHFPRSMDHRVQVARAKKFLRSHVGDDVQLVAVARAAGASMFHLARLYRAITGDTVGRALTRMRIERAARRLSESSTREISSIALEVGFRTPSSLNKAFRAALGLSPTEFRKASVAVRKKALRELEDAPRMPVAYRLSKPRVEHANEMRVVYVRELGPYSQVSAPLAWAQLEVRIASTPLVACQRVGASYDDPDIVSVDSLRYDAGVIVGPAPKLAARGGPPPRLASRGGPSPDAPPGTKIATWPGGRFAVFDYHGDYRFMADAFREIFADWTRHGFTTRDAPCLELYRTDPSETSLDSWHTELWIPITEDKPRHA